MTVRLRPHHLLCMLTYAREGYTSAFVANFDHVIRQIQSGATVLIVSGPDDICATLCDEAERHCLDDDVRERDRRAASDLGELLGTPLREDTRLEIVDALLARLRNAFASSEIRAACAGCQWHGMCTSLARQGFRASRLQPPGGGDALPRSLRHRGQ